MPLSFVRIPVGSIWSRPALAEHWGYRAYQALARGVVTPANDNKIVLFVTEEKQVSATNYQDILLEDILNWEGPNDHFAEERMIRANDKGEEIHLFHRPRHHMDFEYRGELKVISVNRNTNSPSQFIFEVLDANRQSWTRDQLLAAFYLYMQLKPKEIQITSPSVNDFAESFKKPVQAVAAKLRAFTQLDPVLAQDVRRASDNVTELDKAVWREFEEDWTNTTLAAGEAFESVVGSQSPEAMLDEGGSSDAQYLFKEGQTREAIVEVRRNQYVFRKMVLSSYDSRCCISGLRNDRLLIASHIIPWASDEKNRLNPANGLCLSALHDRAYDQGLITVLPDYSIRVSPQLIEQQEDAFLTESLLSYHGRSINLPGRFRPNPEFLRKHADRFGYLSN